MSRVGWYPTPYTYLIEIVRDRWLSADSLRAEPDTVRYKASSYLAENLANILTFLLSEDGKTDSEVTPLDALGILKKNLDAVFNLARNPRSTQDRIKVLAAVEAVKGNPDGARTYAQWSASSEIGCADILAVAYLVKARMDFNVNKLDKASLDVAIALIANKEVNERRS